MDKKKFSEILERQRIDDNKTITKGSLKTFMYGKMDWIKVFRDAYERRKSSWRELGHIEEWRNATDEVLFAVWKQIEEEIERLNTTLEVQER
jgi:L-lactate utilization protein LutB